MLMRHGHMVHIPTDPMTRQSDYCQGNNGRENPPFWKDTSAHRRVVFLTSEMPCEAHHVFSLTSSHPSVFFLFYKIKIAHDQPCSLMAGQITEWESRYSDWSTCDKRLSKKPLQAYRLTLQRPNTCLNYRRAFYNKACTVCATGSESQRNTLSSRW